MDDVLYLFEVNGFDFEIQQENSFSLAKNS